MNYKEYIYNTLNTENFCLTTLYALRATRRDIIVGDTVLKACKRHLSDLEKALDPSMPCYKYYFDREKANHVFKFFDKFIKHTKGKLASQPVKLELWENFIIGNIFGWKYKETDLRKFNLAYTQVARKNGKSLLSSGISLYMFIADKEPGAECYCASVKKDTAKIVFSDALKIIRQDKNLRKHIRIQESLSTMHFKNNIFKAISGDKDQDGLNIHYANIDEYHLFKENELYEVLVSGTQARQQPLINIITTAGESRGATSPCYQMYEYCKQILDNVLENENMFIYIAEMNKDDDIYNPQNWIKSNPNLGVSISLDTLEKDFIRARDNNEMDNFRIKQINTWIQRKDSYFPMDKWSEEDPLDNLELKKSLYGKKCYIGIDLSSKIDLTGVSVVFPLDNGEYAVINKCFVPKETVYQKEIKDRVPYKRWIDHGHIIATDGDVIDIEFIVKYIEDISKKYKIQNISCDPWNATALMTKLDSLGYEVIETRQGYKTLSEPTKYIKELMITNKLKHFNNPVLRWCTANAIPKFDANENVMLDKSKSINRIDAIASTINAMTRAMYSEYDNKLEEYISDENFSF
ncbi:MAG: terminase TerL endonuclease subunit [Clostridium saudiense]|nr:terminase TerL endonuclease subunit [Clostridium saudiense]